jgi:hypothetical protein
VVTTSVVLEGRFPLIVKPVAPSLVRDLLPTAPGRERPLEAAVHSSSPLQGEFSQ